MNFKRITSAILSTALIGTSFNVRAAENEVAVAPKTTKSTTIRKTSQLPKRKRQPKRLAPAKRSNAPQKKQTNIEALWGTLKPWQQNLILYGILPASAMIGIYELYKHFPSGGLPAEFNGFDWPQFVTTVHAYVRIRRNTVAESGIPRNVHHDFEYHIQEFYNTENSFFDLEGFQRAKIIRRDVNRHRLDHWVQEVNNLIEQEARRRATEARRIEEAEREFANFDWNAFTAAVRTYAAHGRTNPNESPSPLITYDFEHHIQQFYNAENSIFNLDAFKREKIYTGLLSRDTLQDWVVYVNSFIESRQRAEERRRAEEARRRAAEARRREEARRRIVEITGHDPDFDDLNWQDFSIIVGEYARFKSTATPDQLPEYIERLYHTYMEEFVSAPNYTFNHDAFVTNKINRNIIQETNMANDPISARMAIDTWRAQVFEFLLNQGAAQDRERGDLNAEGSGIDFPGIREIMSQFAAINSDLVGDDGLRQVVLELPNGGRDWEIFTLIRDRLQETLRRDQHIATDSEIQSTLSHYTPEVINAWTAEMKTFLVNVPRDWFRLEPDTERLNNSLRLINLGTDETPVRLKFGVPLVCANKLSAWRRVEVRDDEITRENLGPKIRELAGGEPMGDLLTSFGRPISDDWVEYRNATFYDYVFNYTGWHMGRGRFGELLEHDRESLRDLVRLFKAYDSLSPIGKLAFKEQFRAIASGANNMCKNELAQIIAQLCMKMDAMIPGGIPIDNPHALLSLAMTSAKLSSLKTASDTTMQRLEQSAWTAEYQRCLYSLAANMFGLSVAGTSDHGRDTANLILSGDPARTAYDHGTFRHVIGQQLLKDFNTLFFNDFISEFIKSANLTLGGLDTETAETFARQMSNNPISFRDLEALLSLPMVKAFLRERRNNWIPADIRDGVCNALDTVSLHNRLTALANALDDDDGVENAENPTDRISTRQNLLNYINYVDDERTPTNIHSIGDIANLIAYNGAFCNGDHQVDNLPEFAGGKYTAAIAPLIALHGMGAISVVH